jgi:hypothetical protein
MNENNTELRSGIGIFPILKNDILTSLIRNKDIRMNFIQKGIIAGLCAFAFTASAYAAVECKVHNHKGKVWFGTASSRSSASAKALKSCARHSRAKNCVVEYCRKHEVREKKHEPVIHVHHRVEVEYWQCTSMNAQIQNFVRMGKSRAQAIENSMSYCFTNSAGNQCTLLGCSRYEN